MVLLRGGADFKHLLTHLSDTLERKLLQREAAFVTVRSRHSPPGIKEGVMLRGFVSLIACCGLLVTSFSAQTSSTPQANSQPVVQTSPQASTPSTGSSIPDAHASAAVPALAGFGLEDGTPVKLRLSRNLSSSSDKKGD